MINDLSNYLSSSKFIMRNINGILDYVLGMVNLGEGVEIAKFNNWGDKGAAEGELKAVFSSLNVILNKDFSDVNSFLSLTDAELNVFLQSDIISNTLVNVLQAYSGPGKQLDFLTIGENVSWLDSEEVATTFTVSGTEALITSLPGATKYHVYNNQRNK